MDDTTLEDLQALGSRLWSASAGGWHHHPGALAWSARSVEGAGPVRRWVEQGVLAGWAWAREPTWLQICVDAADRHATDVAREAVAWFIEQAPDDEPARATVPADEHLLLRVLDEAGFLAEPGAETVQHHLDLTRLPALREVPGYRLRAVREGEAVQRAACHRATRGTSGAPGRRPAVTSTSYAAVMATAPYRADLDWVAVAGDGAWVASCLVWLDPATGVALVEPVGCAPDHRGRGLVTAVGLAALHAAHDAGATTALLCVREDLPHPALRALCQALGFTPGERAVTLVREPE